MTRRGWSAYWAHYPTSCSGVSRSRPRAISAPTDADAYGRGLGLVMLAMAGACAIKRSTEPDAETELSDERRVADGRGEHRLEDRPDDRSDNHGGAR